jgi:hypothetical protein
LTLTEELASALRMMPCACTLRWIHDGAEREVVKMCSRCKAIQRFDEEFSALRSPELIQ